MSTARHRARSGARGAVYVEFLIAFLPVLILFLCLWQVSILYTTKLFVDHAAFSGARAAAVIIAENPNRVDDSGGPASVNVLTGRRNRLVQDAVGIALMPLILDGTVIFYNVQYPDPAKPGGPNVMLEQKYPGMTETNVSMARVRVRAMMNCRIAFANAIMCNGLISRIAGALGTGPIFPPYLYVLSEAVFPYQGASYTYDPNDDGSQNGQASNNTGSPLASNNISGCFAAGTPVETAAGTRPIEQIAANDVVLSRDEQTGQLAYERVVAVSVTPDRPLVDVRLTEAATIRATPNHLFWTADRQWVPAGDLTPGETLFSARFEELHVAGVEPEADHETVYNFEVERTHTYFVGSASALVHNQVVCGDGGAGDGGGGTPNWKSVPAFGHTFLTHGQGKAVTTSLTGRAGGTGQEQGQWLNNQNAAQIIWANKPTTPGEAVDISIPPGLGQVIMPDGSIVPVTHARIVASATGIDTAFPILP